MCIFTGTGNTGVWIPFHLGTQTWQRGPAQTGTVIKEGVHLYGKLAGCLEEPCRCTNGVEKRCKGPQLLAMKEQGTHPHLSPLCSRVSILVKAAGSAATIPQYKELHAVSLLCVVPSAGWSCRG